MVRFGYSRLAALVFASIVTAAPVAAQEPSAALRDTVQSSLTEIAAAPQQLFQGEWESEPKRPRALVPLYLSFATLQVLDAHSTRRALGRGAVESNPLMKGVAGNSTALLAVKAAGATGVIFATEKMWRKNKGAAVLFIVAANLGMAWVVQHNYRSVK